jgi:hypothetical protein
MHSDELVANKRKKVSLSPEEREVLRSLFFKALLLTIIIIILSSVILFFGLQFLMRKTSFANFGLSPSMSAMNASQFVSTYIVIALSNILLMITLCIIVLYLALHNIVLPIMRITRGIKDRMVSLENKTKLYVRESDKLLVPLVEMVNKLIFDRFPKKT